jgi:hypothetical protein
MRVQLLASPLKQHCVHWQPHCRGQQAQHGSAMLLGDAAHSSAKPCTAAYAHRAHLLSASSCSPHPLCCHMLFQQELV